MCFSTVVFKTVGLSLFLLVLIVRSQDPEIIGPKSSNGVGEGDEEPLEELFAVTLRTIDVPGADFIRLYGIKLNVTDSLRNNHTIVKFMGIPYAVPPVDKLRFQRPAMKTLTEDFEATKLPPPCPQKAVDGEVVGQEDCLYLNIFAPQSNARGRSSKLPVLIWFHGESPERVSAAKFSLLTSGSAQDVDPEVFLYNRVLVVVPQYRLGSLGFLSTVNEDLNGNMGMFDKMLAMEWVQRYIGDFGGDSKQVTVMGHGSSAMNLGLMATSDLARGLFHRMILMSGSPMSPVALDSTPKQTFAEIALQNACPSFPTLQFVRCMQERRVKSLVSADDRLITGKHLGRMKLPLPVIQKDADGRFLPPIIYKHPSVTINQGTFEPVPLIIGVSSSEMSGFLPSIAGKLTVDEINRTIFSSDIVLRHFIRSILSRNFVNPELLSDLVAFEYFSGLNVTERHEQAKDLVEEMLSDFLYFIPALSMAKMWSKFAPVYFYVFDYVPSVNPNGNGMRSEGQRQPINPGLFQASHGSDVQFLMNGYKGSAYDREIASNLVDFWVNFIHKGSPLNSGTDWPQFREETREFLRIRDEIEPSARFRLRQEQFWTELIPSISSKVCPTGGGAGARGPGSGGRTGSIAASPSLAFSDSQRKSQRGPIIFKDVNELDFSKRFFTFGTIVDEDGL